MPLDPQTMDRSPIPLPYSNDMGGFTGQGPIYDPSNVPARVSPPSQDPAPIDDEDNFQKWKKKYAAGKDDKDSVLRAAYRAGLTPDDGVQSDGQSQQIPSSAFPSNPPPRVGSTVPPSAFPGSGNSIPSTGGPATQAYMQSLQNPQAPPPVWRQILGGVASMLGPTRGFAPLIEYGPQRLAEMRQQQQLGEAAKTEQTQEQINERMAAAQTNEGYRRDIASQNQQNRQQAEQDRQQTEIDKFTGAGGQILAPGQDGTGPAIPSGYFKTPSASYDAPGSVRVKPTPEEQARQKNLATQGNWMTITPEMAQAIPDMGFKGDGTEKVPPQVFNGIQATLRKVQSNPQLRFEHFTNDAGDVTTIGFDPTTGEQKTKSVVKGIGSTKNTSAEAGTWALQEDKDGNPVLFNSKTAATMPAVGLQRAGTKQEQDAEYQKTVGDLEGSVGFANSYLEQGRKDPNNFSGASDEALMEAFFNATKPTTGFRMNQAQMNVLQSTRSLQGSLEARVKHWMYPNAPMFSDVQRENIVKTMNEVLAAKKKGTAASPNPASANNPSPGSGPPTVTTKAQRDALPSGTVYKDSQGNLATKP